MKWFLIISALVMFTACNRHIVKTISKGEKLEREESVVIDTSSVQAIFKTEVSERYGDTLNAALYFDETTLSDSIESGGIKIKANFIPAGRGYKVKVVATAKPVENKTTTSLQTSEHAARIEQKITATDSIYFTHDVKKDVKPSFGLSLMWLFLLVVVVLAVYIYRKFKLF